MVTIKIKYTLNNIQDKLLLNNYILQYNSVYHVAFNNLLKGIKNRINDLLKLNNVLLLDSWFIQSANQEAKYLYSLVKNQKIIFGGRKNYFQRLKGLISKEQYKVVRLSPLCSYGERKSGTKAVHGNRKFKLSDDLSYIILKLSKQKIILNLPGKLHNNIKSQLRLIYNHQLLDDIPITYKIDREYIYITIDEKIYNINYHYIDNRIMSIDMNPNYIGWSIVDWKSESDFNIIKSGIISIKLLNDYDNSLNNKGLNSNSKERVYVSNKRNHEIILVCKNLINKAIYYKCRLFSIEDLNFKNNYKNKSHKLNKLVNNQWCRYKFINNLLKRCNIFNIKLIKVKAEYSSFVGNFLFRSLNLPDPILASIEISRRGYEFYNQYISKIKQIKKNIILPDLNLFNDLYIKSLEEFNILVDRFKSLLELYNFFKKSKMMYRLSIDNNLLFSSLFSNKSQIKLIYIIIK